MNVVKEKNSTADKQAKRDLHQQNNQANVYNLALLFSRLLNIQKIDREVKRNKTKDKKQERELPE